MKNSQFLKRLFKTLALSMVMVLAGFAHAADPSMAEVYKAAESGNFSQAEAMMKQVLSEHPNSAKAHFVHAEILAKEGRLAAAKDELQIAEKLAPGLPFAKQEAVRGLEARLNATAPVAQPSANSYQNTQSSSTASGYMPWVLGFAALAFILFIVRMMTRPREIYSPMPGYGGNPGGFVIEGEHKNIYISGDTALTMDMKLIPMRTKLDLAIFPIGNNFTMDVEDSILASDFVECDKILGVHYDTFGYIEINHEDAIRKFFDKGKDLMLLDIGDYIQL